MPEVIRALRRGPGEEYQGNPSTSSPPRRPVAPGAGAQDAHGRRGVRRHHIKGLDPLHPSGRPGRLREQVGFKLCALLAGKLQRPHAREFLFGDDVEEDAAAFHLYARMVNRDSPPAMPPPRCVPTR